MRISFELMGDRARIVRGTAPDATLRVRGPGLVLAGLFLNGIEAPAELPSEIAVNDADGLVDQIASFSRGDGAASLSCDSPHRGCIHHALPHC